MTKLRGYLQRRAATRERQAHWQRLGRGRNGQRQGQGSDSESKKGGVGTMTDAGTVVATKPGHGWAALRVGRQQRQQ